MRTKTLLIAAAALAVGVASSMAQTYSLNVVGYVNLPIAANHFWFLGNQLQTGSDVNQTNNDAATVLANGAISDPNGALNTELYYWTGGGYQIVSYFSAADWNAYWGSPGPAGFYDIGSGIQYNLALNQGAGNYLFNPAGNPTATITLVGTVVQGASTITIHQGFNALSIIQPVSTNIDSALTGFVGTSDPNGANNDVLYVPAAGGGYGIALYFSAADWNTYWGSPGPAGFYDIGSGIYESANPNFMPKVGQAFFLYHAVAGNRSEERRVGKE